MGKNLVLALGLAGVMIAGILWYFLGYSNNVPVLTPTITATPDKSNLIILESPKPNDVVISPLTVTGRARGNWYFEASFPIKIYDSTGKLLGSSHAQAEGEWMTTDFVPFRGILNFTSSATATGTLVLEKDNPSGLPENYDELRIPVRFNPAMRAVQLYYYNPDKDKDSGGNIMCSKQGLVPVQRQIPITNTPIQDTIRLLMQGDLAVQEKADGITTEYPLEEFELIGASLNDGVLTLSFKDPDNKTSGGSCRVAVLWAQIEATAKQFSTVKEVKFSPDYLFQP